MPKGKDRTLQNIETFIRRRLPRKLQSDLKNLCIIKEPDLECAAYFWLRRFIGEDPHWKILARRYVSRTGRYIDLLLFKNKRPRIAIELKWFKTHIGEKDRDSLKSAREKLGVQKTYWISTLPPDRQQVREEKKTREKYVHHQILLSLGLDRDDLEKWKQDRTKYRDDMQTGKRHRPR